MKRMLVFIIISFIFLLTGCTIHDNVDSSNNSLKNNKVSQKNQIYSFGPMANLSKIDDEKKEELQIILNEFGDVPKDMVSFNVINTHYNEDGSLIVDLFIRNGHAEPIFNIDVQLKLIKDGKVIAVAPFNFTKEEFGILEANNSRPWTILYYPEDLKNKSADLNGFVIEGENIQYEY